MTDRDIITVTMRAGDQLWSVAAADTVSGVTVSTMHTHSGMAFLSAQRSLERALRDVDTPERDPDHHYGFALVNRDGATMGLLHSTQCDFMHEPCPYSRAWSEAGLNRSWRREDLARWMRVRIGELGGDGKMSVVPFGPAGKEKS